MRHKEPSLIPTSTGYVRSRDLNAYLSNLSICTHGCKHCYKMEGAELENALHHDFVSGFIYNTNNLFGIRFVANVENIFCPGWFKVVSGSTTTRVPFDTFLQTVGYILSKHSEQHPSLHYISRISQ